MLGFVQEAKDDGLEIVTGGNKLELEGKFGGGSFMEPTIIAAPTPEPRICRDEVFGPVVTVTPFSTEEEVIQWANDTRYGLSGVLQTRDARRAHRVAGQILVGTLWVNDFFVRDLRAPFGGMKHSGIGREGGQYSLDVFTEMQNICVAVSPVGRTRKARIVMDVEKAAAMLDRAWQEREPIEPFSEAFGLDDVNVAYRVQQAWIRMMQSRGETIVGRKIGLTSKAMQQQLGVSEPDYGALPASWEVPMEEGRGEVDVSRLIQPRVEGEIAFRLAEPLEGPGVTILDVFRATDAVASAVEIIDSRIRDWRIRLVDTVADNASCGGFAVGAWEPARQALDLRRLGMVMYVDGEPGAIGAARRRWATPPAASRGLANKLGSMGDRLEAGDIVLSGSLGPAVPVRPESGVRLEIGGLAPVTLAFRGG